MKIKVRSVRDTFRRAGLAFTKQPREIEVDEKVLDILIGEPMLVVEVSEPHRAGSEKKTGKAG